MEHKSEKKPLLTRISISAFFLFLNLFLSAQNTGIYGKILDEETGEPVPFASVSVFSKDFNTLLDGTISDDNGDFKMNNPDLKEIHVVVSFIGYTPDTLQNIVIARKGGPVNLGEINLASSVTELGGIEVQGFARTTSRQIDRQVYRPEDFETTRGGTAADILNRLPALSVDPDGTVSLRGTTDFTVYLNGKPTQMDPSVLLGQIPANSIQNIEVITVPTARYDAQGSGGILNITTKQKGAEGLSVVADGLLGGAPWANETHSLSSQDLNYNRWGGGLNLIFQKNDLTLFGGLNHTKRNLKSYRTGAARLLQADGSYYHMIAEGQRLEWQQNYSASIGFDYRLNHSGSLSAFYYFGHRNQGRTAHYIYRNFFGNENRDPVDGIDPRLRWIYNPNTDDRTGVFHTTNVDYTHNFDNSRLQVSLLYEHSGLSWTLDNPDYEVDNDGRQEGLITHFYQSDETPLNGYRLNIGYEKNLDNGNSLGFGFQPQYLEQTGSFHFDTLNVAAGTWETNQQFMNNIDLSRGIYAGYLEYSGNSGKFSFMAGLRLEYTDQTLELDNPDYLNIFQRPAQPVFEVKQLDWFPTLHLQYGLNETSTVIMAASRRINRPPTKNMAPFLYRRHHEVYVVGDPELKPEYLANAELSLRKDVGVQQFTLTGFYRGTDNAIFRVNTVYEQENVLIRSFTNAGNVQAFGAELNASLSAGSFAKFFAGASLYDFHVQGEIFGFRENNRSTNWSLKGNMNLFISTSLKFTADLDLRSATVTTQGRDEMFHVTNAALNYTPPGLPGWDFGIKIIDVLSSNSQGLFTRAYNASGTRIFYQDTVIDRSGPIIEITASYSFNMNGRRAQKAGSEFGTEQF